MHVLRLIFIRLDQKKFPQKVTVNVLKFFYKPWYPHIYEYSPPNSGFYLLLGLPSPPHLLCCNSVHNLSGRSGPLAGPWPLGRSELSGCWQMHIYCIYNKYSLNKLTTLSLNQKAFINSNIVNKIQCKYWFNYKIVNGSQRKSSKC